MFGLGATELIVILVIALVIFGPGKLPELGSALGKGLKDFRKSVESTDDEAHSHLDEDSASKEDA